MYFDNKCGKKIAAPFVGGRSQQSCRWPTNLLEINLDKSHRGVLTAIVAAVFLIAWFVLHAAERIMTDFGGGECAP